MFPLQTASQNSCLKPLLFFCLPKMALFVDTQESLIIWAPIQFAANLTGLVKKISMQLVYPRGKVCHLSSCLSVQKDLKSINT